MINIVKFRSEFLKPAAVLFVQGYKKQCRAVPTQPISMGDPDLVAGKLSVFNGTQPGLAAIDKGQLVGYLGWFIADDFRGPGIRGCTVRSGRSYSINPEAARFWMRYFEPVCLSLMRHPEALV
jgi:hypothetical protein